MARNRNKIDKGVRARIRTAVKIGKREHPSADSVEFHAYSDHPIIAVWKDGKARLFQYRGL